MPTVSDAADAARIAREFGKDAIGHEYFTLEEVKKVGKKWHVTLSTLSRSFELRIDAPSGKVETYQPLTKS